MHINFIQNSLFLKFSYVHYLVFNEYILIEKLHSKYNVKLHITVPIRSALHSTLWYCWKTYIFTLNFNIWLVPFMNISFKNVSLLDLQAAEIVIPHHRFNIKHNHTETKKGQKKSYQFLKLKFYEFSLCLMFWYFRSNVTGDQGQNKETPGVYHNKTGHLK
jgi:hypothetical protein